jgi:hypothetical protein
LAAHNLETLRRDSVPKRNGLQEPFFSILLGRFGVIQVTAKPLPGHTRKNGSSEEFVGESVAVNRSAPGGGFASAAL